MITNEAEAQIYQELVSAPPTDGSAAACGTGAAPAGDLTTSFLSICAAVKDNRIMPAGTLPLPERVAIAEALGAGDDLAHSSIRFGLGRWTTEEEVDYVVEKLTTVVRRLREMSPLYEMVKEGVDLSKMQWVTH